MNWLYTPDEIVAMAKTDKLLTELEARAASHTEWTSEQCCRVKALSDKLNPEPTKL